MARLAEIARQLRGDSEERRIKGAVRFFRPYLSTSILRVALKGPASIL
jgi:hypothetical protein